MNYFKLDRVLKLLYNSNHFDRMFILCNHNTLHKVRAITLDLDAKAEVNIITLNNIEDDTVFVVW